MLQAIADHDGARRANRHTCLHRLERGQLVLGRGDTVHHRQQDALAFLRLESRPLARVERCPSCADRAPRVLPVACRDGGDRLLRGGVHDVERLSGGGVDPLATDVVAVVPDFGA
jgi:hypothetical protein